jgi:hypothetical protein
MNARVLIGCLSGRQSGQRRLIDTAVEGPWRWFVSRGCFGRQGGGALLGVAAGRRFLEILWVWNALFELQRGAQTLPHTVVTEMAMEKDFVVLRSRCRGALFCVIAQVGRGVPAW